MDKIMEAWETGVHQTDIYHMILELLQKQEYKNQDLVVEILDRMSSNEETNDIVQDFIYDNKYKLLRKELTSME
jgi:transposase-like protein